MSRKCWELPFFLSILHKNNGLKKYGIIEITDRTIYDKAIEEKISQYFNNQNTPRIDHSELLNDDNKNYQVWLVGKESDPDRESDIKITVFFDSKNKRDYMRLFHPKN